MMKNTEGKVLSGADAFKLQDTYGFPIDLTREIAEENGMTVNNEEFEELLKKAKPISLSYSETFFITVPGTIFPHTTNQKK